MLACIMLNAHRSGDSFDMHHAECSSYSILSVARSARKSQYPVVGIGHIQRPCGIVCSCKFFSRYSEFVDNAQHIICFSLHLCQIRVLGLLKGFYKGSLKGV